MSNDSVELTLYLHHETQDGILLSETGEEADAKWLPKKFVEQGEKRSKKEPIYEFSIARWLAEREGLI